MQPNLFDYSARYPNQPGHRNTDTSFQAAKDVAVKAPLVRQAVLECLLQHPAGLTTEEISNLLGIAYATIQPRTSELRKTSQIVDSGERRKAISSGKNVIVWVATGNNRGQQ